MAVTVKNEVHTSKDYCRVPLLLKKLSKQKLLLLMILPAFLVTLVFNYIPIFGIQIAFKRYNVGKGIWGSEWIGIYWFIQFFKNPYCWRIIRNTLLIGTLNFAINFPAPIIFALLLNEIQHKAYKKLVQTVSYLPYFISAVIIVGMIKEFTSQSGVVNYLISFFGGHPILFFTRAEWFRTLYVISEMWQGIGWGTIIYLAVLSGVSLELYEAAMLDGAGRFQRMWYITIPSLIPTIVLLLILSIPGIVNTNTDKIILMYSPSTYETADVIGSYVYREGIEGGQFSYTTAVGLMLSIVSFLLLYLSNKVSRRTSENSLW